VDAALATSGLLPARLELEVTEGVLLNETEETLRTLEQLRALGVSIAMDDFGTGYSSLGYLRKFQFDKIKIDRSFVGGLGRTEDAMAIIRAVIGMSRALGIRCNAEGVETEEQARMLSEEQCDEVQGFLFGRPMSASEWRAVLRAEPRLGRAA
jgi:EAL domain-containing protein (putative c-di-GMP-specific phosphodiesterase class I)